MKKLTQLLFSVLILLLLSLNLSAQQSEYEKAKSEIKQVLGTVPQFIDAVPPQMLPMAWELFKSSNNPDNQIPNKYTELIKLAVAAQIPCQYCVLAHKVNAKAAGATDQEINEAVMHGAWVRHWSMIVQSTTMSFDDFEKEYMGIVNYMAEHATPVKQANLRRTLYFKFKSEVSKKEIDDVRATFQGLRDKIDGMTEAIWMVSTDKDATFTHYLMLEFETDEALKAYEEHPDHKAIAAKGPSLMAGFHMKDYRVE